MTKLHLTLGTASIHITPNAPCNAFCVGNVKKVKFVKVIADLDTKQYSSFYSIITRGMFTALLTFI